jgi:hypothetical protein
VRVEQGRGLPPQDLQLASATALGRRGGGPGLGVGDAGRGQHLGRHRRGQTHADHRLDEVSPAQDSGLDLADHLA